MQVDQYKQLSQQVQHDQRMQHDQNAQAAAVAAKPHAQDTPSKKEELQARVGPRLVPMTHHATVTEFC